MLCRIENCTRPKGKRKGLCPTHYERQRTGVGDVNGPILDTTDNKGRTCKADCDRPATRHGYCEMHDARVLKTGTSDPAEFIDPGCSVEDCTAPHYGLGLCHIHWTRVRHHGYTDLQPRMAQTCPADGCDRAVDGDNLCSMHYQRVWLHGSTALPESSQKGATHANWAGDDVNYHGAHLRVKRAKGLAALYTCELCNVAQARHWAYDHRDPNELTNARGQVYSGNPDRYFPACIKCHTRFDRYPSREDILRIAKEFQSE
jgi:hypothetical protein